MDAHATLSGKALYLELTNKEYTAQVIVMPEGITSTGVKLRPSLMRRTVSKWSPRKTWEQDKIHTSPAYSSKVEADGAGFRFVPASDEDATNIALESLRTVAELLNYLVEQGWTLREKPLAIEVSQEDINDLENFVTPAAFMRRLTRTRTAAGFPDDLFPA